MLRKSLSPNFWLSWRVECREERVWSAGTAPAPDRTLRRKSVPGEQLPDSDLEVQIERKDLGLSHWQNHPLNLVHPVQGEEVV